MPQTGSGVHPTVQVKVRSIEGSGNATEIGTAPAGTGRWAGLGRMHLEGWDQERRERLREQQHRQRGGARRTAPRRMKS